MNPKDLSPGWQPGDPLPAEAAIRQDDNAYAALKAQRTTAGEIAPAWKRDIREQSENLTGDFKTDLAALYHDLSNTPPFLTEIGHISKDYLVTLRVAWSILTSPGPRERQNEAHSVAVFPRRNGTFRYFVRASLGGELRTFAAFDSVDGTESEFGTDNGLETAMRLADVVSFRFADYKLRGVKPKYNFSAELARTDLESSERLRLLLNRLEKVFLDHKIISEVREPEVRDRKVTARAVNEKLIAILEKLDTLDKQNRELRAEQRVILDRLGERSSSALPDTPKLTSGLT